MKRASRGRPFLHGILALLVGLIWARVCCWIGLRHEEVWAMVVTLGWNAASWGLVLIIAGTVVLTAGEPDRSGVIEWLSLAGVLAVLVSILPLFLGLGWVLYISLMGLFVGEKWAAISWIGWCLAVWGWEQLSDDTSQ